MKYELDTNDTGQGSTAVICGDDNEPSGS